MLLATVVMFALIGPELPISVFRPATVDRLFVGLICPATVLMFVAFELTALMFVAFELTALMFDAFE